MKLVGDWFLWEIKYCMLITVCIYNKLQFLVAKAWNCVQVNLPYMNSHWNLRSHSSVGCRNKIVILRTLFKFKIAFNEGFSHTHTIIYIFHPRDECCAVLWSHLNAHWMRRLELILGWLHLLRYDNGGVACRKWKSYWNRKQTIDIQQQQQQQHTSSLFFVFVFFCFFIKHFAY